MSVYYTGFYLNKVPTGFGIYTGIALTNSGNFPTEYTVKISDTTLYNNLGSPLSSASSLDGFLPNTLYISTDLNDYDSQNQEATQTVNPSESGIFYVLHRPFDNFAVGQATTGYEKARLTIESVSSAGGRDQDIIIDVTGQRIFVQPTSKKVGKFYAVKDYIPGSAVNLQFNWGIIDLDNYITGFKIDIANDSSFTAPLVSTAEYKIPLNTSSDDPLYGGFDGLKGEDFRITAQNLQVGVNYYARIQPLNVNGFGPYTYAAGYTTYYPILSSEIYSGNLAAPQNLKFEPTGLFLTKISDNETDFDLFDYVYQANNKSTDFTKYTGINVKFFPNTKPLATYIASSVNKGAINFIEPNDKQISYSVNGSNIFRVELEFENISLYGHGGQGLTFNADGTYNNPTAGGPVFNIDNISYIDNTNTERKMQYYIYKDVDSIFYAGSAGGKGWLITENTNETTNEVKIEGATIKYLYDYNLASIKPSP